jgi:translation initiation factor IF-3
MKLAVNSYIRGELLIKEKHTRVNEEIRAPKIRVIDADGGQLGVMAPQEAMRIAENRGLDLVEIVPSANPPVCKVINFGKYKYEQQKRDKLQHKHQKVAQLKEIRFHPNTDTHDFEFKARHAREFIKDGHKVKATVVFKGREISYQEFGREILARLTERLSDVAKVDQPIHMEGRSMIVMFTPDKTKKKVESTDTSNQPLS